VSAAKVDLLRNGASDALRNCADFLRDEHGLTEAADQIEAVDASVVELVEAAKQLLEAHRGHERATNCAQWNTGDVSASLRMHIAIFRIGGAA